MKDQVIKDNFYEDIFKAGAYLDKIQEKKNAGANAGTKKASKPKSSRG